MTRQWHADWYLTCGDCSDQGFIDGGVGSRQAQPTSAAIAKGWRLIGSTWVCERCAAKRDQKKGTADEPASD